MLDLVAPIHQEGFCSQDEVCSMFVCKGLLSVLFQNAGSDSDMVDGSVVSDSNDIGDSPVCCVPFMCIISFAYT